jgi:hypothetical protein
MMFSGSKRRQVLYVSLRSKFQTYLNLFDFITQNIKHFSRNFPVSLLLDIS